ncbi:MAG: HD domain-containing protein [Chloroflexi bacterium]|nr:HD domain-containing protein [Chloroflexota bacterium]
MPVFVHTIDVTLLCLEAYPEWRERHPALSLEAITIGSLLHDLNKVSARRAHLRSHSEIMSTDPIEAVKEAVEVLDRVQLEARIRYERDMLEHIWHIVVSHHGRFGKIAPATPEAALVHQCDLYSATYHRCAPVDANDILPLYDAGCKCSAIAAKLGVGTSVVRSRLSDACKAERCQDWVALRDIWRQRGSVLVGPLERINQMEQVKTLIRLANESPQPIVEAIKRAAKAREK